MNSHLHNPEAFLLCFHSLRKMKEHIMSNHSCDFRVRHQVIFPCCKRNLLLMRPGTRTTLIVLNPLFWSTDLKQLSSFLWKGKAFWKEFKLAKVCNKSMWLVRFGCGCFSFYLVLHLPAPLATCSSKPAYLSCVWARWRCFENLEWSKCWSPSEIRRWRYQRRFRWRFRWQLRWQKGGAKEKSHPASNASNINAMRDTCRLPLQEVVYSLITS